MKINVKGNLLTSVVFGSVDFAMDEEVGVDATVILLIQVQMVENTIKLIHENPELAAALKADYGREVAQTIG